MVTNDTYSSNTSCQSNRVDTAIKGNNNNGVITILERIAITTVFVSPGLFSLFFFTATFSSLGERFFSLNISRTFSISELCDHDVLTLLPLFR